MYIVLIDVLISSAAQLQKCLINLLTYLLTYFGLLQTCLLTTLTCDHWPLTYWPLTETVWRVVVYVLWGICCCCLLQRWYVGLSSWWRLLCKLFGKDRHVYSVIEIEMSGLKF